MLRLVLLPLFFLSFYVGTDAQCSTIDITPTRPENPGLDSEGPYCAGELVVFEISVEFFSDQIGTGNNCQWIQGIIPSIGVGWDLENNDIDEEAPGSGWFWLEDGEVDLNISSNTFGIQTNSNGENELFEGGSMDFGEFIPRGWWFVSDGAVACENDGDPDTMWGVPTTCGNATTIEYDLELYVTQDFDSSFCGDDEFLKLDLFIMADGMTGCWTNATCADDTPLVTRAEITCSNGGNEEVEAVFTESQCSGSLTEIELSTLTGYEIFVEISEESSTEVEGANSYVFTTTGFIEDVLINTGTDTEIVIYQAYTADPDSGCPGPSTFIEIEVYSELTINEFDPILVCPNTGLQFFPEIEGGAGGYSFEWSDGSDFEFIELPLEGDPEGANSVSVIVTDDEDCESTFTIDYFLIEDILPSIQGETILLQDGTLDNSILNLVFTPGSSGPYDIDWTVLPTTGLEYDVINNDLTFTINEEASLLGDYVVTAIIEDEFDCIFETMVTVTITDNLPNCALNDSLNLLALFEDWNGNSWPLNTSVYRDSLLNLNIPNQGVRWSTSLPIAQWHGVGVSSEGCVTQLILNNQNIQDTIPSALYNLSQLETLVLDNNGLTGMLIDSFERLGDLKLLSLSNNQLGGSLPLSLQFSDSLRYVRLDNNQLTGAIPAVWSNINDLVSLDLSQNNLSSCYPEFIKELEQFNSISNPLLPWTGDHLPFINNQNQINATCEDGNNNTFFDVIQSNCECRGLLLSEIDLDGDSYFADTDCNDNDPNINPGAMDIPDNGIDEDCDGVDTTTLSDGDGDSYLSDVDCNDNDPNINPGAVELCDGIDNNCDGNIDEGLAMVRYYIDMDGDGFGDETNSVVSCLQPPNFVAQSGDCNDMDPSISPAAVESCDDIDNNCNGLIDDGLSVVNLFLDRDGDGYGDSNSMISDCRLVTGYVQLDGDCDDNNPAINPGIAEIPYNGLDDDCSATTLDDDFDQDGFVLAQDCDDQNPNVRPNALELCNNIDDNCNNEVDEGLPLATYFLDADSDGYGDAASFISSCSQPTGYVIPSTDCNDNDASINPGATDFPDNNIDENCDGADATAFEDNDGDGVTNETDCNDNDPDSFPGATEICDGVDNNCDGIIDDGLMQTTYFEDADNDGFGNAASGFESCEMSITGFVTNGDDCDDANPNINPNQAESTYNGIDDDCNPVTLDDDLDGDGFILEDDCDDNNAEINPNQAESTYNGIDDDCNPATLDDDLDGDGFVLEDDCDDNNAEINPNATEIANNGIDEDCDGLDSPSAVHDLGGVEVNIYPNPARDFVNITFSKTYNYKVNLYTTSGRLLIKEDRAAVIEIGELASGIYILEVFIPETNQKAIEKLVVWK